MSLIVGGTAHFRGAVGHLPRHLGALLLLRADDLDRFFVCRVGFWQQPWQQPARKQASTCGHRRPHTCSKPPRASVKDPIPTPRAGGSSPPGATISEYGSGAWPQPCCTSRRGLDSGTSASA